MNATADRRDRTAYHEAGHAVLSLEYGLPLTRVSIVADDESLGRTSHEEIAGFEPDIDGSDETLLQVERIIMRNLAGMIAEARYAGPRRASSAGADHDQRVAADLAERVSGSSKQAAAFLKWLRIRTDDKVAMRWSAIDAVARVLLTEGSLDVGQLEAVITGAQARPSTSR